MSVKSIDVTNILPYMFLNKRTMIIGKPLTGKTTLVRCILQIMKGSFADYIIATNKPDNFTNILPANHIYTQLKSAELQDIYEKASYHKITSEICNNGKVLRALCDKIDSYNRSIGKQVEKCTNGPNFSNLKQKIRDNDSIIARLQLEPDEYIACHKLDTCSKMCLVIDGGVDLIDDWDKYKQEDNVALCLIGLADFSDLTIIVTCEDDNKLSSNVFRKMNNIIFTDKISASICVNKASRSFQAKKRKEIAALSNLVYVEDSHNKILVTLNDFHTDVICANITPEEQLLPDEVFDLELQKLQLKDL